MKALITVTRWYLALQKPRTCIQFVQSVPLEYFLKSYFRTAISRLSGLRGRSGPRALPVNRSVQVANVGKVKQIPSGSRGAHEGLAREESLVARIARRYGHRDTQAASLSRQAVQRILALRQCVPLLGLTGLCLVDKPSLVTPDEELEGVCVEIRNIVDKINFDVDTQSMLTIPEDKQITLSDFEIGDPIAKGCNAVVYRARYEPKEPSCSSIREVDEELVDAIAESPPLSSSPPRKYAAEFESPAGSVDVPIEVENASTDSFDLAIKMMFNYDAASNSAAIWNSLARECAPTANNQFSETKETHLPSHPCIVDIKITFADRVPLLRGAKQLYPHALPPRLNDQGIGRNATMFLVMKRYNCSLRAFLRQKSKQNEALSEKMKLSLSVQLFEAVAHLVQNGVAHRDLKSDNILVDIGNRPGEIQVALSDFGCCLTRADCIKPLKLAYTSKQVSKGGNLALMPPEVQTAQAGLLSFIDYSRADLWSIATIVYEIYGQENPFFEGHLSARSYADRDVPELLGAPPVVRTLVKHCLKRDPAQRPTPELAATVLQMLLHAPRTLFSMENKAPQRVVQWLCDLAVDALFAARKEEVNDRRSVNQSLKRMFLAKVRLHLVLEAIEYIKSCRDDDAAEREDQENDEQAGQVDEKADGALRTSKPLVSPQTSNQNV
ncbi:serine/threonine-protein kinase PINK1, mitochondrial [Galendromus occidentalis]|uniref:non-specific serine/threonine protein kinase n=1 Tax=Galendromus occidentalis TaxID=34638 RepID=A0AAJ6QX95_9ACAR|nr:serine/threonine-protein kinase PINK1, mitochondrial [Galendromus occidentalis]